MAQILDLGNVIGPQGPKGDTGERGLQGATGVSGGKGDTGATGPAGAKGADGATWLSGTVAPTTQGKTGDYYINTSNFDVYSKATGSWVKTGNIKGATGATGATGPAGAKGTTGDKGATGAIGPQGPAGAAGAKGATGDRGLQGLQGVKGDTGPAGTNTNMAGATTSVAGKAGLAPAPVAGAANRYLRSDGTWSVPPDTNTVYAHPTGAGSTHIPAGGAAGQFLKWSSTGVATWAADNNTTYGVATTAVDGLMSKADKAKVDKIKPITISTADPNGGADGDVWIKYS